MPNLIVDEKRIEDTIRSMLGNTFIVLISCRLLWRFILRIEKDIERFGLFGSGRGYTVSTYFSNRLDVHSQKAHSILAPFARYREGKLKNYRKVPEEEKIFGALGLLCTGRRNRLSRLHILP